MATCSYCVGQDKSVICTPHRAVTSLTSSPTSPTLFTPCQPRGPSGCHLHVPGTHSALAVLFLENSSPR